MSTLKGHTGPVLDVDLSSNDKLLVTCADGMTVLNCLVDVGKDEFGYLYIINLLFIFAIILQIGQCTYGLLKILWIKTTKVYELIFLTITQH